MKNIIFSAVVIAFVLVSCNQKAKETTNDQTHNMNNGSRMMDNDSTMMYNNSHYMNNGSMMMDNDTTMMRDKSNTMNNHEKMYACPMHPEIIGKKNEKCSICGMELTQPVFDEKGGK